MPGETKDFDTPRRLPVQGTARLVVLYFTVAYSFSDFTSPPLFQADDPSVIGDAINKQPISDQHHNAVKELQQLVGGEFSVYII